MRCAARPGARRRKRAPGEYVAWWLQIDLTRLIVEFRYTAFCISAIVLHNHHRFKLSAEAEIRGNSRIYGCIDTQE